MYQFSIAVLRIACSMLHTAKYLYRHTELQNMEGHKATFILPLKLNDRLGYAAIDLRTTRAKLVTTALEKYLDECDRQKQTEQSEQAS